MVRKGIIAAALTVCTASAYAQGGTAVMGVYTADEDLHVEVDTSLKFERAALELMELSQRTMTPRQAIAQAMLASGDTCLSFDVKCAESISRQLGAEKLLWGSIAHGKPGLYVVTVNRFDNRTGALETKTTQNVPSHDVANEMLRLLGVPEERIMDEQARGLSGAAGQPPPMPFRGVETAVVEVPAKPNTTEVEVIGPAQAAKSVEPVQNEYVAGAPIAVEGSNHRWRKVLGWTSIGLGVGGAAMAVAAAFRVMKFDDDPSLKSYRDRFPSSENVCSAAHDRKLSGNRENAVAREEARVAEVCDASDRLKALQWVGLSVAVTGLGGGTYLLLKPVVSSSRAGLQLTTKF